MIFHNTISRSRLCRVKWPCVTLLFYIFFIRAACADSLSYGPVVYGRIVERILITLFGGLCLFLGYLLFYRTTQAEGEVEAKTGDKLYLKIRNVAPGTFFALFGAGILVASLIYQIQLPDGAHLAIPPTERTNLDEKKRQVAAISALVTFYRTHKESSTTDVERNALPKAVQISDSLQGDLIDSLFGDGAYNLFKEVDVRRARGDTGWQNNLSPEDRERVKQIDDLYSVNALLGG